jgi:hypothetical protein
MTVQIPGKSAFSYVIARLKLKKKLNKGKSKTISVRCMKAYGEVGVIAPHILSLGTRCRWMVSFTPRPLYARERNPVPVE